MVVFILVGVESLIVQYRLSQTKLFIKELKMSARHDSEVSVYIHHPSGFAKYITENYDLSEVKVSCDNDFVTINYNADKHTTLVENIRHAAMGWDAAIIGYYR